MPVLFYLSVCGVLVAFSGSTEVQCVAKPYGVKMCEELCSSLDKCTSPLFVNNELSCLLPVARERVSSLKLMSKTKGEVLITKNVVHGYKKMKAGKDTLFIKIQRDRKSWTEAQRLCKSYDGRLVKVDTEEKVRALQNFVWRDAMRISFWVGLRDQQDDDKFYWTDGSPMGINRWGPREPSHIYVNRKGERLPEDCVAILYYFPKGLRFSDVTCNKRNGYICERSMSHCV